MSPQKSIEEELRLGCDLWVFPHKVANEGYRTRGQQRGTAIAVVAAPKVGCESVAHRRASVLQARSNEDANKAGNGTRVRCEGNELCIGRDGGGALIRAEQGGSLGIHERVRIMQSEKVSLLGGRGEVIKP